MRSDLLLEKTSVRASDGTRLYCAVGGKGPPILLCDGVFCEGHIWKYLLPELLETNTVVHWNYPGHGASEDPSYWAELSVERLAMDAETVLKHTGQERAVVVGHSLGVQVALELARQKKDDLAGLVLICGSPGRLIENFHENAILEFAVPLLDLVTRFMPGTVAKIWRAFPTEKLLRPALLTGEVNKRLIRTKDLAAYLSKLNRVDLRIGLQILEAAGRHDAVPYLPSLDIPALIIGGQEDTFTPPGRSKLMASLIPGAKLHLFPWGTHSLPLEQPEVVNLRVKRFLSDIGWLG